MTVGPMFFAPGAVAGGNSDAVAIAAKLTSWWEMTEGSGSRLDSKGTNHLSEGGTVSTAAGVRGSDTAVSFAGAGDLRVASNSSLQVPSGGGDHCIFGWVYVPSNTNQTFVSKWNQTTSSALEYQIDFNSGNARGINGGTAYSIATLTPPAAGAWHFYVLWRDSVDGKVRLQIDDGTIAVTASASNPSVNTTQLCFGRINGTGTPMTGRLQRWGWIKGGFLTPSERTYLYGSGLGVTYSELQAAAA